MSDEKVTLQLVGLHPNVRQEMWKPTEKELDEILDIIASRLPIEKLMSISSARDKARMIWEYVISRLP